MNTLNSIAVPVTRKKSGGQASRAKTSSGAVPPVMGTVRGRGNLVSPTIRDAGHRLRTPQRAHRFAIGQTVSVTFNPIRPASVGTLFKIVTCMPISGPSLQYRVRSDDEPYERVVIEEDLQPVEAEAADQI